MQVLRDNFAATLPLLEDALQRCQFYALDLEMTGLFLPDIQETYLDDVEERYQVVCLPAFASILLLATSMHACMMCTLEHLIWPRRLLHDVGAHHCVGARRKPRDLRFCRFHRICQ